MQRVKLGRSGLEVSRLAYGGGPLAGGMGHFDEQAGVASVRRAFDHGINLFDTARLYGRSEELIGRVLADLLSSHRDEVVIATKSGVQPSADSPDGIVRDSSERALRADLEASLRALGVDYVDILQIHWPAWDLPLAQTATVLAAMRQEGKIRHIGVSNFSAAQLAEFDEGAAAETLQPPYSMLHRDPERDELAYAGEHDVGVLVYGPLAHGLLAKADFDPARDFGAGDLRQTHGLFEPAALAHNRAVIERLATFAHERGFTLGQLAIAWVLAHPAVHTAIVGSANPAHIDSAVRAADISLSADELAAIDALLEGALGGFWPASWLRRPPTPESQ